MESNKIIDGYNYIRTITNKTPAVGLILGSGLGDFANTLEDAISIPFSDIPHFPLPTVEGHQGYFVFGNYKGVSVVALRGRLHFYEGFTPQEITRPVRIMKKLGVETVIITNAAGGVNLDFSAGALMLIKDHINYTGSNPLMGPNLDEFGPRFPDASDIYTKSLRAKLKAATNNIGLPLKEGVYLQYSGPNYETPAEIRFFRTIGADAVGMSTVPEALVAAHSKMKVIGISCITNMASGVLEEKLDHAHVVEVANRVKGEFTKVLSHAIKIGAEK